MIYEILIRIFYDIKSTWFTIIGNDEKRRFYDCVNLIISIVKYNQYTNLNFSLFTIEELELAKKELDNFSWFGEDVYKPIREKLENTIKRATDLIDNVNNEIINLEKETISKKDLYLKLRKSQCISINRLINENSRVDLNDYVIKNPEVKSNKSLYLGIVLSFSLSYILLSEIL